MVSQRTIYYFLRLGSLLQGGCRLEVGSGGIDRVARIVVGDRGSLGGWWFSCVNGAFIYGRANEVMYVPAVPFLLI